METNRGFLTIAYGDSKYIRMAKALARSIRLHSSNAKLAVVTDRKKLDANLFDFIIPINLEYPSGVAQKLFVDKYTPFDETLFIDSDCIAYKNIDNIWNFYENKYGFGIKGWGYLTKEDRHYYAVNDLNLFFQSAQVDKIGLFNRGVFYFDKSLQAQNVFKTARLLFDNRNSLSLTTFKNSLANDEPIFAVSLEKNGVDILPLCTQDHVMLNVSGKLKNQYQINVLKGCSRFSKNDEIVEPYIIHYHVDCSDFFIYWRDIFRLELPSALRSSFIPDMLGFLYSIYRRRFFYFSRVLNKLNLNFNTK